MKPRLVGGDYLLDLSSIEIEKSVDGETYTSITDKSVLDQLTDLKSFIGKSGMIKPVWFKLLNGETDELVVTRGSLSTSDGTTFLIRILLVGFILTLSVEFTQMLNEDDEPLDDWYIDTNDAKYIMISEAQEIGAISELPVFENIVDKDGHKRFVEGDVVLADRLSEVVTPLYGKWSLSGSHLMIVFSGSALTDAVISAGMLCLTQGLPKWVTDKIAILFASNSISIDTITWHADDYTTQTEGATLQKYTSAETVELSVYGNALTLTKDRKFRLQFDLLIDNETPAP